MPLPTVTLEGRLVDEVELRFTAQGVAVAKMRVVATKQKQNESGQWVDDKVLWINVTAWRNLAENCAESLTKGDLLVAVGSLATNEWESKEGEKRSAIEMTAFSVAADLKFRTVKHGEGKTTRSSGGETPTKDPWTNTDDPPF